jgi:hypothetical protein
MELAEKLGRLQLFGVNPEIFQKFQILLLPENIFESEKREDLFEAADAITVLKKLREAKVQAAGPLDLGLDVGTLSRHSGDRWLGTVWIRDTVVIPTLITVIGGLIVTQIDRGLSKAPPPKVHAEVYLEEKKGFKHFSYEGNGDDLIKMLEAFGK